MNRLIDETGNRYGRLRVLGRADKKHQHGTTMAHWWCHCDCDKAIVVSGTNLRTGRSRSCGCLRRDNTSKANLVDRTGLRYGRLLVLKRTGNDKHRHTHWLCHCDCGNDVVVSGNHLHSEATQSCGCLRVERSLVAHLLPKGVTAFNALVRSFKSDAKRRGLEWQLTDEQVRHLTKQRCHYCGAKPSRIKRSKGSVGDYAYNGVDRVDNTRGYTIDNVVSCCFTCNRAKNTMTLEEFRTWLVRICAHFLAGDNRD